MESSILFPVWWHSPIRVPHPTEGAPPNRGAYMIVDLLQGIVCQSNKVCWVVFAHANRVMNTLKDTVLSKVNLWRLGLCREGTWRGY